MAVSLAVVAVTNVSAAAPKPCTPGSAKNRAAGLLYVKWTKSHPTPSVSQQKQELATIAKQIGCQPAG